MKTQEINVIDNSTIISTTILNINYIARTATVRVGMKTQESARFLFKTVEAKLSNNLYQWLTYAPTKNLYRWLTYARTNNFYQWLTYARTKTGTNGEMLTLTGCDMFCSKNKIKDIIGHTFTCRNDCTQYERNPFRVHINVDGVVILYSVDHPTSDRTPKDVYGNYVNLYPGSYKRLEVFKAKVVA